LRIFQKSVFFLFESGSLDSPGGPSSNRRYSITGVLRRRAIMNFTLRKALQKPNPQSPVDASTLFGDQTLSGGANRRRCLTVHCQNASKTVKILDQRLFPLSYFIIGHGGIGIGDSFYYSALQDIFGAGCLLRALSSSGG
jgi:hypothetical protein